MSPAPALVWVCHFGAKEHKETVERFRHTLSEGVGWWTALWQQHWFKLLYCLVSICVLLPSICNSELSYGTGLEVTPWRDHLISYVDIRTHPGPLPSSETTVLPQLRKKEEGKCCRPCTSFHFCYCRKIHLNCCFYTSFAIQVSNTAVHCLLTRPLTSSVCLNSLECLQFCHLMLHLSFML